MKHLFNKTVLFQKTSIIFLGIICTLFFFTEMVAQVALPNRKNKQEKKTQQDPFLNEQIKNSDPVGFVAGFDYKTNYIWRGISIYNKDAGMISPWVSIVSPEGWGSFTVAGEIASEALGDGGREVEDFRRYNSLNAGIDLQAFVDSTTIFGLSGWYYWHYNSLDMENHDTSYGTVTAFLKIVSIPFAPKLSYSHDLYVDKNAIIGKNFYSDFFIEATFQQDFHLNQRSKVGFGLSGAYYNNLTRKKSGISHTSSFLLLESHFSYTSFYSKANLAFIPYGDFSKTYDEEGNKTGEDLYKWWIEFGARISF